MLPSVCQNNTSMVQHVCPNSKRHTCFVLFWRNIVGLAILENSEKGQLIKNTPLGPVGSLTIQVFYFRVIFVDSAAAPAFRALNEGYSCRRMRWNGRLCCKFLRRGRTYGLEKIQACSQDVLHHMTYLCSVVRYI